MPDKVNGNAIQLLDPDKRFSSLLLPYVLPYIVYVAFSNIPETILGPEAAQAAKLATTGITLWFFRKVYWFGPFRIRHVMVALLGFPVVLLAWIGPFYLLSAAGLYDMAYQNGNASVSNGYLALRLLNSVVLVALFEELFMRVYVMGWLYQTYQQIRQKGFVASLLDTFDQYPMKLTRLPLNRFSVIVTALLFAAGHSPGEYLSALSYFLFTTWLFYKSSSLWVCILIHALTNLAIGLLAHYGAMGWLWV